MKTKLNSSSRRLVIGTSNYDGPTKQTVYKSFVDLYSDLITDLGLSATGSQISIERISLWISKFLDELWEQMYHAPNGQFIHQFADDCKARRNDLEKVTSDMLNGKAPAFPGDYFIFENPDKLICLTDLKYQPNNFIAVCNYIEEVEEIVSQVTLSKRPGFYANLYKINFYIASKMNISEEFFDANREKITLLFNLAVTLGQAYERMNPTPDVMEEFGLDLLNLLRQESKDPSPEFWKLFLSVAEDILQPKTNKNRYVHDIIDARNYILNQKWEYSYEDYYLAAKASTSYFKDSNGRNLKLPAIFSSVFEVDPIKDAPEVQEFDQTYGYKSAYLDSYQLPAGMKVDQKVVVTQMIPNPGKFKPRGIHVGCNSVQDRCKFVHRMLAKFLNRIPSCCMNQHFRGVQFLKKVSNPSYRQVHQNNIFVSDFSNATDTLNQEFQCQALGVLFGETLSNFWRFISKLPKTFRHPLNGVLEDYTQMTGQPQGLLASFDAFSIAHIFLICMLMKQYGLESQSLGNTLAIVGDDSIVSYPSRLEQEGSSNVGKTFYQFHSWLCSEVSLIKNESKTGKSFFDENGYYPSEILDFAKISIQDGRFVTPIPYGLASCYSQKAGSSDLQLLLWLNSKGITFKKLFYKKVFNAYCRKADQLMLVTSVLSSGEIPFLKEFKEDRLNSCIPKEIQGVSLYEYFRLNLEHSFLSSVLSESNSENLSSSEFLDKCLKQMDKDFYHFRNDIPQEVIFKLPEQHKYQQMLSKNLHLAQDMQDMINWSNSETIKDYFDVLIGEDYYPLFKEIISWDKAISQAVKIDDENIWELFYQQDFSPFKDLADPLKDFQVKSMKKVASQTTIILQSSARKAREIISKSKVLDSEKVNAYSKFIDCYIHYIDSSEELDPHYDSVA